MKIKVFNLSLLVFIVFILPHVAEASFSVQSSHPRILITPDGITSLRNKSKNISPYKEAYTALKSKVNSWPSPTTNRYIIGNQIQAIVFVALMEDYNAIYLNKVEQWITNLFETQGAVKSALSGDNGTIWGSADTILGIAMAYDWLYPALSHEKRIQYGTYLRDFQKAVITEQGGMTRDASRADYSNQFYYFDGMLAITGIALYNEGIDDPLALTYLNTFDNYAHNNMIPTVNQIGGSNGGWHEGLGYVDRAMTYFTLELEVWRMGAGENLFPQATGLKGLSKWLFYSTQPDGDVVNIGDVTGWPVKWREQTGRRSVLLGARYQDGFSQYMASNINPTMSKNWPYIIFYLLWYDPLVPAIDLSAIDTAEYFDGVGWISMRSSWDIDATFAMFYSGNFYFGHQHKDQNSFMIFKNAPLAIDNGVYNVGVPNYKWATRYHNTILIGNLGSETSIEDGTAGQTGANPKYYIPDPENSNSDKGDILLFDNGPDFTYAVGDASKAYDVSRLINYIRKFLYLKPDYFIILDRVVTPTTSHPIRWLLQSDNNPEIFGNEIRITNGNGRLFSKTILPDSVNVSANAVFLGKARYGDGNYRIEVIPTVSRYEEYFLHILWATDSAVTAMPAAQLLNSISGNLVGVYFAGHTVLLSKNGTIVAQETYSISATSATKHIICDLRPGGLYEIYQNGNLIMAQTASKGGIVRFDSQGGGNFNIKTVSPSAPAGLKVN